VSCCHFRRCRVAHAFAADLKFPMDRDAVAKVAQQCNMYVLEHDSGIVKP
jgi:hypothetical protein